MSRLLRACQSLKQPIAASSPLQISSIAQRSESIAQQSRCYAAFTFSKKPWSSDSENNGQDKKGKDQKEDSDVEVQKEDQTALAGAVFLAGALAFSALRFLLPRFLQRFGGRAAGGASAAALSQALKQTKGKPSTPIDSMNQEQWEKLMKEVRKLSGWGVDNFGSDRKKS